MDYERIKQSANEILATRACENSYIEYKASAKQKAKILKTICAYGNNYYNNDLQYIFIGVEEENDEGNKAVPKVPLTGMNEGNLEKCKNEINALRPYLCPNVSFEIIANCFEGKNYLLIIVPRQSGGPFMVSDRAEKDKTINLKFGRYVRVEAESRLARVDEEYDLIRKFANYHFSSSPSMEATIGDLDAELLREYLTRTSDREITETLDKTQMALSLSLIDKNDPAQRRVKNFAVLMFCLHPEQFINYSYVEIIVDMFGTKRKMGSRYIKGPLWKQYDNVVGYISDNFLDTITVREDGEALNRKVDNFPFVAVEELVANAIVHNNYENGKPIQIYVSQEQINIVNYNKPLPPLKIEDLNSRSFFNERDTENPEIRDMFKALGIIESFGTGIGEAKRAMMKNGSDELSYKVFDEPSDVTSVVIPVNRECLEIKNGNSPSEEDKIQIIRRKISDSSYSKCTKDSMLKLFSLLEFDVFSNSQIREILNCTEMTATSYIRRLDELGVIRKVDGLGKGKYRFK